MLTTYDSAGRLDAGEELFFARQHEQIDQTIREIRYPELKGRSHFAINFEGGPAVETLTYRVLDRYGSAQVGLGFPRVGIKAQERSMKVHPLTASYGHSFQEVRSAQAIGMNLEDAEARAARRKIAELEDKIIYLGEKESGILGAFNHPNFPVMTGRYPLNRSTASSLIVDEFLEFIDKVSDLSKGVEAINAVLMPRKLLAFMKRPYSDAAPQYTIFKLVQDAYPDIQFDWCKWCTGAGSGGEDIMFGYNRNSENMEVRIPHEFETFPPRIGDKEDYKVNCHERFGGLQVRFAVGLIYEIAA